MKQPRRIKTVLIAATILATGTILGLQYYSRHSLKEVSETQQRIISETRMTTEAQSLSANLRAVESLTQAFLISGDQKLLREQESHLAEARIEIVNLKRLAPTSQEKQLVETISSLFDQKVRFFENIPAVFSSWGRDSALAYVNDAKGQALMLHLEKECDSLRRTDMSSMDELLSNNLRAEEQSRNVDILGIIIIVIISVGSVYVTLRDIDRISKLNIDLDEAKKRAEQSAILKEQFMANMSHEIRTPMNAIVGFTNRLSRTPMNSEQQEYTGSIRSSAETLLTIVNDILDFSKLDAGMVRFENIPFSVSALLDSVVMMFHDKAAAKGIVLQQQSAAGIPDLLAGDPTRLTQVLVNLVGNALKFTEKGTVTIEAFVADRNETRCTVGFRISDTGIGIPAEKQESVFDRFSQGSNETQRKYGGTGLGLSIVKSLIEQQEGQIQVESEPGKGSVFTVQIPYRWISSSARTAKTATAKVQDSLSSFPGGLRVLVAEDNKLNQRLAELLLTDWGISYDVVSDGLQAIEKLRSGNYQLLLLDIQMPGLNGYDTARKIRNELHLGIPIIAMTAHALPGEREKCLECGMNDYLAKPIRENEMHEALLKQLLPEQWENSSATASDKVVDLLYLRDLSGEDDAFIEEMKSIFLTEAPAELAVLDDAIRQQDHEKIYQAAHKLKSTVLFMGLGPRLLSHLETLEHIGNSRGSLPEAEHHFHIVNHVCQDAFHELNP